MKENNIWEGIGNIEQKIVDQFVTMDNKLQKRADRAKNTKVCIRAVALAACLAIIVTAIPVAVMLNRDDAGENSEVTTPVEDIVVTPGGENGDNKSLNVIYCDSLMIKKEGLIQNAFNDKNVEIKDIDEFRPYSQFFPLVGTMIEPDINVPEKLDFTVGGTSVKATLECVYYGNKLDKITDKTLKENEKIAKYSISELNGDSSNLFSGYDVVYYSVANKEIIGLYTSSLPLYAEEKVSEEELWEIVKKDVTDLYGEDFLTKYSVRIVSRDSDSTFDQKGRRYNAIFKRKIGEFVVDEGVNLIYNGNGNLVQISSRNLNSFNSVESKITDKVLSEVEEKASKLLEGRLVEVKKLEISYDGEVCVYYEYLKREGDENFPISMFGHFRIKANIG